MTNGNGILCTSRRGATMRSSASTRRTSKRRTMKGSQQKIPNLTGKQGGQGWREEREGRALTPSGKHDFTLLPAKPHQWFRKVGTIKHMLTCNSDI